jgi:acyl carrier protein
MATGDVGTAIDLTDRAALRRELALMIASCTAAPPSDAELHDELPLGAEGIGLDSIAIVELLVACEHRWATSLPAELLEQVPLTIGTLLDYLQRPARPE